MLAYVKAWPGRVWAVEGSQRCRPFPGAAAARRPVRYVVDVPAKLAARVRLFDTGHNRKTDAHDAHSIAAVAVRTKTLRVLAVDGELAALRLLVDRRDALSRRRVQCVNRLHGVAGGTGSGTGQEGHHRTARPRRCWPRSGPVTSPARPAVASPPRSWPSCSPSTPKIKKSSAELKVMVLARGSHLMDLRGVGPVVAARVLADVGDVARFR